MVINKLSFFAIQFEVNEGCLLMGLVDTYRNECQYYVNECVSEWLMQTQSSSSTNTRQSTYPTLSCMEFLTRDVYVWGFCHDDTYWASF